MSPRENPERGVLSTCDGQTVTLTVRPSEAIFPNPERLKNEVLGFASDGQTDPVTVRPSASRQSEFEFQISRWNQRRSDRPLSRSDRQVRRNL